MTRSKLLIDAALFRRRTVCRDDADDFFMADYLHYKQQRLGLSTADCGVAEVY